MRYFLKIYKLTIALIFTLTGVFLCKDIAVCAESCLRVPVISVLRKKELKDQAKITEANRILLYSICHDINNRATSLFVSWDNVTTGLSEIDSKETDILNKLYIENNGLRGWLRSLKKMAGKARQIFDFDILCNSLKEYINNIKNLLQEFKTAYPDAVYLHNEDIKRIEDDVAWLLAYKDMLLEIEGSSDINEIITCANNVEHGRYKLELYRGGLVFKRTMPYESIIISAILINLKRNARDASNRQDRVSVNTSKKGDNIIIEFSDKGSGMTREVLERIGIKGFSEKGSARGMGIWLMLEYLKEKGGSIEIDSKPEGSEALRLTFDERLEKRTISKSDRTETGTTVIIAIPATASTETSTSAIGNLYREQSGTCTYLLRPPLVSNEYLGRNRLTESFKENFKSHYGLQEVFWGKRASMKKLKSMTGYNLGHVPTIHGDGTFFSVKQAKKLIRNSEAVVVRTKTKGRMSGELKLALIHPMDAHLFKDGAEKIFIQGFSLSGSPVGLGNVEFDRTYIDRIEALFRGGVKNQKHPEVMAVVDIYTEHKNDANYFKEAFLKGSYTEKHQALVALLVSDAVFSSRNMPRREMIQKTVLSLLASSILPKPGTVQVDNNYNAPASLAQLAQYGFSPAEVVAGFSGTGLSDAKIIEKSGTRTVHVNTDLENPLGHKVIKWRWSKSGDSFTKKTWDNGAETIDLSTNRQDMVFRFIVFGMRYADFKIVFEDSAGQKIEFNSSEKLTIWDGKQYNLFRLDELEGRNLSFNWGAVKPPKFIAVSPQAGTVTIKNIEILNVKDVRERGIGIGMFLNKPEEGIIGNDLPPLGGYTGITGSRPPASISSYLNIYDDVEAMIDRCYGLRPGQVPHLVLHFWLSQKMSKLSKSSARDEYVEILKASQRIKAKIIRREKVDRDEFYRTLLGWNDILKRISSGEVDDTLVKMAKAAAKYKKTLLLRPLPEMNGSWNAWSVRNEEEADDFIAAWKHMAEIFWANGADNVVFVFSPHNYEPEDLQQTRHYQLVDYMMYHLQEYINAVGLDAFSYPPGGGDLNALATGLLDMAGKYQIPVIMGETSSAMSEDDKRRFWEHMEEKLKDGVFSRQPIAGVVVFSEEKWEDGIKNFHPPRDIMKRWEEDEFFAANPFIQLRGGRRDAVGNIREPALPSSESQVVADDVYSLGNTQWFTLLPDGREEWAYKENTGGTYGFMQNTEIPDEYRKYPGSDITSRFEFVMPMEIIDARFKLTIEDSQGKKITPDSNKFLKYIRDAELVISLTDIIRYGTGDKTSFDWVGLLSQASFEPFSDSGRAILGRSSIRKIEGTGIIENLNSTRHRAADETVKLDENYPDPFGPAGTNIRYTLNKASDSIKIKIFDIKGRLVKDLGKVDGSIGPHVIKWDGLDRFGMPVPDGQYLIQIITDGNPGKAIKTIKLGLIPFLLSKISYNRTGPDDPVRTRP